jgi:hypothetical protein
LLVESSSSHTAKKNLVELARAQKSLKSPNEDLCSVGRSLINDKLIDCERTIPERVDVFVAWLATDTSLIDPSHFSVSVDELLSEQSLLMLPVLLEMLARLPLRFGVWKSCDQLMARDWSS